MTNPKVTDDYLDNRQAERLSRILELKAKADYTHKLLIEGWLNGKHSKELLAKDREIAEALEEAERRFRLGATVSNLTGGQS